MTDTREDAEYYTVHPREETGFHCVCGTEHLWRYAHRYAGDWHFIYLTCPTCGEGHKKEPREEEKREFQGYARMKKVDERRFIRENPVDPYPDDLDAEAFKLLTTEKEHGD